MDSIINLIKKKKDYDDLYSRHKVCTKCKLANLPYVYK